MVDRARFSSIRSVAFELVGVGVQHIALRLLASHSVGGIADRAILVAGSRVHSVGSTDSGHAGWAFDSSDDAVDDFAIGASVLVLAVGEGCGHAYFGETGLIGSVACEQVWIGSDDEGLDLVHKVIIDRCGALKSLGNEEVSEAFDGRVGLV